MQSHTFSSARGVPVIINGSTSSHHIRQEASSSSAPPRSSSLNLKQKIRDQQMRAKAAAGLPPTFIPSFHNENSVKRMTYRRLGRTDLMVSKVGLGCGPIGGMMGELGDSIPLIVESAVKDGINLIDTAYWYGRERSETLLGQALSSIPRGAYYICTKVGRFELDFVRAFDFRADKILESITDSLKRLRLTYLDLVFVQIHDMEYGHYEKMVLYETLQALEMAKQSGKVRFVGVTGYSLAKLARFLEHASIPVDVVMSYAHGCLNDNSLGRYMAFFQSLGLAVVNAAPLCMGLLTHKGAPPWHPAPQPIRDAVQAALLYCTEKGVSIEKLSLEYGLNFPQCTSCFVGLGSIVHIHAAVDIANGDCELTHTEQRVRDRLMRRHLDLLDNAGWEGMDTALYWKRLNTLGLPALATHRHSSVESLASTLNGVSLRSTTSSSDIASLRGLRRRPASHGPPSMYSSRAYSLSGSRCVLSFGSRSSSFVSTLRPSRAPSSICSPSLRSRRPPLPPLPPRRNTTSTNNH